LILDHPLEILLVLSPCGLFAEEEVVLPDRSRAESIRLNDISAGLEILGVDLLDDVGRRSGRRSSLFPQRSFPLPIRETFPAKLGLIERVPSALPKELHNRTHGAIDDHDAFAQELFERMERGHEAETIAPRGRSARNKSTHQDV
jgi:hypothetical protein